MRNFFLGDTVLIRNYNQIFFKLKYGTAEATLRNRLIVTCPSELALAAHRRRITSVKIHAHRIQRWYNVQSRTNVGKFGAGHTERKLKSPMNFFDGVKHVSCARSL